MPARHVVVDGSNIATEGNSLPTLKQLDEAVREFIRENPDDVVTVVVDATFGHRIPPEERQRFEEAELAGEVVCPPAGAIGRGDAFLLRVADKVGASVLSNDSFQEFHGDYEWLFDKGRLIGGKPVTGVGWIFTPRTPVRGPKSREAVKEAKRKKQRGDRADGAESGLDLAAEKVKAHGAERKVQRAIAVAVDEAVEPAKNGRKRRRRSRSLAAPSDPVNEPYTFISFIASNHLGDEVEGVVDEFSSHGAFVLVGSARCYLPLSAMGPTPPRSAREVLRKGQTERFVIQAFDAMRRGIELAMPGFVRVAGGPTPETVDAEIHRQDEDGSGAEALTAAGRRRRGPGRRTSLNGSVAGDGADVPAVLPGSDEAPAAPARARRPRKAAAPQPVELPDEAAPAVASPGRRSRPAGKKADAAPGVLPAPEAVPVPAERPAPARARKAAGTKVTGETAKAPAKVAAKKAPAGKAVAGTAPPKKVATKKASAEKAPAKKQAAGRAAVVKAVPVEKSAPTAPPVKRGRASSLASAPAQAEKTSARTTSASKASAAKAPAAKSSARKAPAGETAPSKAPTSERAAGRSAASRTGAPKARASKGPGAKAPTTKVMASKVTPSKAAPSKVAPSKVAASKVAASKAAPSKVAPSKVAPSKVAATKVAATKVGATRAAAPAARGRSARAAASGVAAGAPRKRTAKASGEMPARAGAGRAKKTS